jgi:hypothetical protein
MRGSSVAVFQQMIHGEKVPIVRLNHRMQIERG